MRTTTRLSVAVRGILFVIALICTTAIGDYDVRELLSTPAEVVVKYVGMGAGAVLLYLDPSAASALPSTAGHLGSTLAGLFGRTKNEDAPDETA